MRLDRPCVLVVDDDPVNRMFLIRLVEREGYLTLAAKNGRVACDLLAENDVDVILLDIEMPEMDGFGVLERVQQDTRTRHIPVIMISAIEDIDSVVKAIGLGATDYIPKPANKILLRARMDASLNRKRIHDLEQERVRSIFGRFVPTAIVDKVLLQAGEDLRLKGEKCVATIMFADLRGFTSWAEDSSPDLVINALNYYLGSMSDVILDHGGTLVSYMGDGIMAAFGAPIEEECHADLALAAARMMAQEALLDFNTWLKREGLGTGFRIGIGLNSGPVMSGTVGSERRLEYAAVGDTTNTASRLEQMTKEVPHAILISNETYAMLSRHSDDLVFVGEISLRGKRSSVGVWGDGSKGAAAG
ncbi:adenylate/guanylate cyclase domain-containing protein [Kitasatospora sp. NPDC088351]|uniref:adenylate/guanylate cyclase domain-containing protein n=1 Tax=unclassified Kitasatospora TaxID=2633591 RepID=UPI00342D1ABE